LDQREEQPAGRRAVLGRRGDVGYLARWRIDREKIIPEASSPARPSISSHPSGYDEHAAKDSILTWEHIQEGEA